MGAFTTLWEEGHLDNSPRPLSQALDFENGQKLQAAPLGRGTPNPGGAVVVAFAVHSPAPLWWWCRGAQLLFQGRQIQESPGWVFVCHGMNR